MKKSNLIKVLSLPLAALVGFAFKAKIATAVSVAATFVAKTSVFATFWWLFEEPTMPKSLYQKK